MSVLSIAALQLDLKAGNCLEEVITKVRAAHRRFPFIEMVVLSELAICGGGARTAQPRLADCEETLCNLAKELGIWFVPGSIYEDKGDEVYNTTPVINPDGVVVTRYRKMYPFLPYEKNVANGKDICVFDVPGKGKLGVFICYDVWFPEVARSMVSMGAEVLLHPTLTDTTDRDVETAMVRATAAQQQAYVIDVNNVGEQALGHSVIVGPDGEVLHRSQTQEEVMLVEVDFDRVRRTRERGIQGGLGQPLKSFRDAGHVFPCGDALNALGPLQVPEKG